MPAKTWDEVYGAGAQQAASTYPCAACGYAGPCKTDLTSQAELKHLALSVLTEVLERSPRNVSLVPAIRELWDRIEGKAPQSISLDVQDTRMDKMPIERLLRLASMLDEPLVVLPPPSPS